MGDGDCSQRIGRVAGHILCFVENRKLHRSDNGLFWDIPRYDHTINNPPSMLNAWPVMTEASWLAR